MAGKTCWRCVCVVVVVVLVGRIEVGGVGLTCNKSTPGAPFYKK